MSEIVNLRRVRKAKARADATSAADNNRARHGTPKRERALAKVRTEKSERDLTARKLDEK
jgi:hypothetical protein